jgi:hypothetical protein
MLFYLNNRPARTVNTSQRLGGVAVAPRRAPPENKRNTRGTQEEHKRAPPKLLACLTLVPGFEMAFLAHAPACGLWLRPGDLSQRKGTARQSRNRTARSVWSAWSLLPLSNHPCLATAPASWTHSRRFAWQFIHKNPRSLRTSSAAAKVPGRKDFGCWAPSPAA